MDNCIFCKLANGEILTNSIYEDEEFKVILDASPASKGHALILPKKHYANIYEIEPETLGNAAKLAQKVIKHETEILKCDGYNVLQNNGETAGQTVFHYHMHLIPRYKSPEDANWGSWKIKEFSENEKNQICSQMKM